MGTKIKTVGRKSIKNQKFIRLKAQGVLSTQKEIRNFSTQIHLWIINRKYSKSTG